MLAPHREPGMNSGCTSTRLKPLCPSIFSRFSFKICKTMLFLSFYFLFSKADNNPAKAIAPDKSAVEEELSDQQGLIDTQTPSAGLSSAKILSFIKCLFYSSYLDRDVGASGLFVRIST